MLIQLVVTVLHLGYHEIKGFILAEITTGPQTCKLRWKWFRSISSGEKCLLKNLGQQHSAQKCVSTDNQYWDLMSGAFASSGIRVAFSYCVQQVWNYDYHHYLCLLELPANMRKATFALRAFNVETARAMDVASHPKIGLMRCSSGKKP
ncbi:unnamed protein product [Ilex paraguariensis]|uniref:Uncharacterized protein n=1 Tax=Ilex paraguariensis TaxID=185542 RepID=A0ABC8QZ25_9AQUA